MEAIAKAPADGYLLYYYDSGPLTVAPHLTKVGYDKIASFTHLGHVCGSGSLLVVHPSTPFQAVSDVISLSKQQPNKWSYGTSGVGGPHHLSGEYFKAVTGADLLHVPYKGGGPAMTDLMGGQIPMLFSSLGPAIGAVKAARSARLRCLATTLAGVPERAHHGRGRPEGLRLHRLVRHPRPRRPAEGSRRALDPGAGESRPNKAVMEQITATGCDAEILRRRD
jgi:tripartite-type tricarboxylate transporter receptor subunit TctC